MFSLKKVEIANWDYWSRFTVPLDTNIVTLVGPNGSGKTTFLDACRTLLGIDCAGGRDYKRYARQSKAPVVWIRGVVANPKNLQSGRSFFPITADEVTLACRIKKSGGDWERKYFISPDDISIEGLEADATPIGVREYQQRLASAGLSEAMRKVLALEQGATGKLSEYSPQERLKLVWDTFGDQSILDRYQQAKHEYDEVGRELEDAQRMVDNQGATVLLLKQQVEHYQEWERRQTRVIDWQTRLLPVKELHELIEKARDARDIRRKARAKVRENEERVRVQEAELVRLKEFHAQKRQEYDAAKQAFDSANEILTNLRVQHESPQALLKERDRLRRLATAQREGIDSTALARELGERRQTKAQASLERDNSNSKRRDLVSVIQEMQAGKRQHWPEVTRMSTALSAVGIEHAVLSDLIEVLDADWQPAIEGLLGGDRGTIVLRNPEQRAKAMEIAQGQQYRHFVSWELIQAHPGASNRLLAKTRFTGKVPAWVMRALEGTHCVATVQEGIELNKRDPKALWVTPDGYHRSSRGGRFQGAPRREFLLGERGRASALAAAKDELTALDARLKTLNGEVERYGARIGEIEALLAGYDATGQLAARAEEFLNAEMEVGRLQGEIQQAADTWFEADRSQTAANDAQIAAGTNVTKQEGELNTTRSSLGSAKLELQTKQESMRLLIRSIGEKLDGAPQDWRSPSVRAKIVAHHDCADVDASVFKRQADEELNWVKEHAEGKDESVLLRYEKQNDELVRLKSVLEERKTMRSRTLQLVDQQRGRYINVLKGTVRAYLKNVTDLAEMAGIEAIHGEFDVENNDVSLAQAGLDIVFRFDQKAQADLDAADSSGGQKVMKSIVMLVALMLDNRNPSGVVFADEPFAHLDIMNIDRVATFLKKTKAQFILTTPVTHNKNIYAPSRITLVTQTIKPNQRYAPPIGKLVRHETTT